MDSGKVHSNSSFAYGGRTTKKPSSDKGSVINTKDSIVISRKKSDAPVDVRKAAGALFGAKTNPSGKLDWVMKLNPASYGHYAVPLKDGNLVIGTGKKVVKAEGQTGKIVWDFDLKDSIRCKPFEGKDGTLYAPATDSSIYAIDGKTGREKWSFKAEDQFWRSPVEGPDGTIYAASEDSRVYALDGKTGKKLWDFKAKKGFRSTPALSDKGILYAASDDGNLYALDAKTGKKVWEKDVKAFAESPVLGKDNLIHIGSNSGEIYTLSPDTGKVLWKKKVEVWNASSPAVDKNGNLFIREGQGGTVISLDGKTGNELWRRQVSLNSIDQPFIGQDGGLYTAGSQMFEQNSVYALSPDNGRVKWETKIPDRSGMGSNTADVSGKVYLALDDGTVAAVLPPSSFREEAEKMVQKAAEGEKSVEPEKVIERSEKSVNIGGVSLPVRQWGYLEDFINGKLSG